MNGFSVLNDLTGVDVAAMMRAFAAKNALKPDAPVLPEANDTPPAPSEPAE